MSINIPIVNAPNLYVNGLNLTWVDGTHITVAAGRARNSTDVNDIILDALATINGANTGALGLDTGALANNTFYGVYVIGDSTAYKPTSVILSANLVTPALPFGYDMFRRIGLIKTSGAAAILEFQQAGKKMWYGAPISVLAATAAAAMTAQSLAAAIPGVVGPTTVTLQADLLPNAAANFVEIRATGSAVAAGNVKMSGDVAGVHHFDQLECVSGIAAAVQSIDWMTDAASTVALTVSAYVDNF